MLIHKWVYGHAFQGEPNPIFGKGRVWAPSNFLLLTVNVRTCILLATEPPRSLFNQQGSVQLDWGSPVAGGVPIEFPAKKRKASPVCVMFSSRVLVLKHQERRNCQSFALIEDEGGEERKCNNKSVSYLEEEEDAFLSSSFILHCIFLINLNKKGRKKTVLFRDLETFCFLFFFFFFQETSLETGGAKAFAHSDMWTWRRS